MKEYQKKTIETYNTHAKAYEKSRAPFINTDRLEAFVARLSGTRVLDVGCGPGRDCRYFVDHGLTVTGLDLSVGLLALARNAVPEASFVEGDMLRMPFADASFDGVWASAALVHLHRDDIGTAIQEIYRVLVPGGIFYCSVKEGVGDHEESDVRLNGGVRLFSFVSEQEMNRYMTDAGFIVDSSVVVMHDNMLRPIDWVQLFVRKPL
ncbi:MAG: class I SAM-dependent methyltransferase [Candidatus Magasanikbacteria bacterium CG10_big_fil_rev_8_21_14_0_10_43_6]|uniref:Class I SAM-dependent methyltransferase n=1 Tax=Candidatus Magasanikbacteria bacterium CG10_big_fil_rev_8_21_14_0_10_43_6 TaxID=1974650 RepID=A0A2M6W1I3_9BACT|nr:MAG: class I SAM-dependent methyltransferase [Candidatus Magasanikbacteria bacterium CG10_big_fil_rev_8_21_14_0_10_43_6]